MKTYLFINPESITEQQLEKELLPQLPLWRKSQVEKFSFHSGRVLCAKSFLLLKEGLANDFGIHDEISFDYIHNGKPIIKEYPEINFNISHCKTGILCVIDDKHPVGCDIECLSRHIKEELISYCCNDIEKEEILHSTSPQTSFIQLWTRKESFLKYTGDGLNNNLKELFSAPLAQQIKIESYLDCEHDFAYSICSFK